MNISEPLRVTPVLLEQKSGEIKDIINNMANDLNRIQREMDDMRSYWRGDANNAINGKFDDVIRKADSEIQQLLSYPAKIGLMKDVYIKTENTAMQIANNTKTDITM